MLLRYECPALSPTLSAHRLQESYWRQGHTDTYWQCWNHKPITGSWDIVWAGSRGVFTADRSDVFLPNDVSRSKKTDQLLSISMILKSNLQRVTGTNKLHHQVQKSILCTLCNKNWQIVCFNEDRKLMSFLYTHISYQINPQKLLSGLAWNLREGRKNVSIVSVINEIIFIQQTVLTNVYSANKSI